MTDLKKISHSKILIIGDIILDQYIWGDVSRISPEAPVPIVKVERNSNTLGGAGNVASNLSGLGCDVSIIGICGDDSSGLLLNKLLKEISVTNLLIKDKTRPTITKTRVMAQTQQLFRLDDEKTDILSKDIVDEILKVYKKQISNFDAVIISDYGKGLLQSADICQKLINIGKENNKPVVVDPKGKDWERYNNATCITPNTAELELVIGSKLSEDQTIVANSVKEVKDRYNLDMLLLTRGPKGMCLVDEQNNSFFIPTKAREVFDVSGAGDTVISTFTAGLGANLQSFDAAKIANDAAGIVVGKLGTQPVSFSELELNTKLDNDSETPSYIKISTLENAKILIKSWKTCGQKVVFTNGCFDLLHPGHVDLLHKSRALGDRLIIGLNSDDSVRRLKGSERPILSEQDRGSILSALGCVDLVVVFGEDTPLNLIENLQPDILIKGADYKMNEVVGREIVESYGGKVALVPLLKGHSTTGIAEKVKSGKI
ncbi:MAG: bifunctional D-glycero-beta-D-manno-heptose-7-phosphate kinase/D-glycero-beta-D-manno-heptose 1-phosphate adenylyltransferase HldE [Deltaproteobacteria bacterium]|nr:bifunctional D-glycero-beta-D-manno-heptose-7-phosphate kinase/D-glycero-beta-D-manno-heptose 1-phosphate adenylyltransferase HldE [Deltaproteobacteria bacterium]